MSSDLRIEQSRHNTVSPSDFRSVSGLFPTGVTVVTRRLNDGRPYGMTVSSFTSVSLEPPLILVCVDRRARFTEHLPLHTPFIVNVLGEEQQALAQRFAGKEPGDRFEGVAWRPGWSGVPLLLGTVASFACSLDQIVEAGDHLVLLGAVRELLRHEGRALVWCERGYHCLPRLEPSL